MEPVARLSEIPGFNIDRVAAAAGEDPEVLRMENLDTDVPPPAAAVEATRAAVGEDDANSWLPFNGREDLKEAVVAYIERRGGPRYDPLRETVITCGEGEAMLDALLCLTDPGDEVILTDPTYAGMLNRVRLAGAVPRLVPMHSDRNGWRLDLDALSAVATDRTRVVFLNNASFPTGWVATDAAPSRCSGRPTQPGATGSKLVVAGRELRIRREPQRATGAASGYAAPVAEITVKRQGEMLQTLFEILEATPEGIQAKDAIARVEDALELTDFEKATFPKNPGVVRFPKIVRFSTINAVKAGWLQKKNGIWRLTEEGRAALKEFPEPEELFRESGRLYKEWESTQPKKEDGGEAGAEAEGNEKGLVAAATLEEAEEAAQQAIVDHLGSINPYDFQDVVGKLLGAMGYHVVWIAPKGKDGGLDLLAQSDPLGVEGPRIKGQVKRRPGHKATEDELRAFLSLVEPADVGVYISLGGFTGDAEALSRRTSRRVTLIDGDALIGLWAEHFDRVDEEGRQLLPIKPVHYLDLDARSS